MTKPIPATDDPPPITDGNGTTHFFTVYDKFEAGVQITKIGPHEQRLTNVVRGRAMLFIPNAVSLAEQVPMLVYYHGHHGPRLIEGYIKEMPAERDFRPLLKDTKVVLIEPQGGPLSKFGHLGTPAGVTLLLWRAMQKAFAGPPERKLPKPVPSPPSLILAGFSGGGAALKDVVLDSKADYMKLLTEVWCFDSMYSGEGEKMVNFARDSKKKVRVRVSTEVANDKGSPSGQADKIQKLMTEPLRAVVDIEKAVNSTHEGLPGKFVAEWLKK